MLTQGHTFGESFMLGGSDKNRFFNAIALTETIVLTLKKDNYDTAMQAIDRRIY
jgi:CRP-like cAMP-binding protein